MFDHSGSFFANCITQGRGEIQIFSISTDSRTVSSSLITRFELDSSDKISKICWINKANSSGSTPKKRNSRKQSVADSKENSGSVYLAVALENGDILLFSPFKNEVVSRISNSDKLESITSGSNGVEFYGVSHGNIIKFSVNESVAISNSKIDDEFTFGQEIKSKGKTYFALGSSNLHLVDSSSLEGFRFSESTPNTKPIKSLVQSASNDDLLLVSRSDDKRIAIYSIQGKKQVGDFSVSQEILNFKISSNNKVEYVSVQTSDSIVIFESTNTNEAKCIIITDNADKPLEGTLLKNDKLIGYWHKGFEPSFEVIEWDLKSKSEIEVHIDYKEPVKLSTEFTHHEKRSKQSTEFDHLSSKELSEKLNGFLTSNSTSQILELCYGNYIEHTIKTSVREVDSENAIKLFKIISDKVSSKPTRSLNLNIWLKWLFIAHGGYISKQASSYNHLQTLKGSLEKNLKLLPTLLSLQGRLTLLQSQLNLRKEITNAETIEVKEEAEQEDEGPANESDNLIIVNGENDEFDDSDGDGDDIESDGNQTEIQERDP